MKEAKFAPRRALISGYTLVEVMVALSLLTLLMAGVLSFYIQFYTIGFVNEQRNLINKDIRQLTGEFTQTGRQANYYLIYESTESSHHNTPSDRRLDGRSGDLLVFVYNNVDLTGIEKLVCYYRDTDSSSLDALGAIRRADLTYSPASAEPVEKLIPINFNNNNTKLVVELSKGLAEGHLFYNFLGRSIMLNGHIYHGNNAKRVTETYNFTVSPRG